MSHQAVQFAEHTLVRAVRGLFCRSPALPGKRRRAAAARQSRWLGLEQLEPRVLLSADLGAVPVLAAGVDSHSLAAANELGAILRTADDKVTQQAVSVDLSALLLAEGPSSTATIGDEIVVRRSQSLSY